MSKGCISLSTIDYQQLLGNIDIDS